jgi:hypothetical protein
VCHHGGAGTTAAGLRAGLPTVVVPFFGDQFFWGQVVCDAGAGPAPIPIETCSTERLAEAFAVCALAATRTRAEELGAKIRAADGVELVFQSLRRHLSIPANARATPSTWRRCTATPVVSACASPVFASIMQVIPRTGTATSTGRPIGGGRSANSYAVAGTRSSRSSEISRPHLVQMP